MLFSHFEDLSNKLNLYKFIKSMVTTSIIKQPINYYKQLFE